MFIVRLKHYKVSAFGVRRTFAHVRTATIVKLEQIENNFVANAGIDIESDVVISQIVLTQLQTREVQLVKHKSFGYFLHCLQVERDFDLVRHKFGMIVWETIELNEHLLVAAKFKFVHLIVKGLIETACRILLD
jgi:hypothetical protein